MGKKCVIWLYWNPKPKIAPTQKTYLNKKSRDINKMVVSNKVSFD